MSSYTSKRALRRVPVPFMLAEGPQREVAAMLKDGYAGEVRRADERKHLAELRERRGRTMLARRRVRAKARRAEERPSP